EAYPRWLAARASIAVAREDWVAERVAQWPFTPVLALGMLLPAGNEARAALTLRSLLLQALGGWQLHVIAEGDMPEAFAAEPRLVWHRCETRSAALLNEQLVAAGAPCCALRLTCGP